MIETYKGVVYPWHCDHMGHMNVKYYSEKFDEATWQFFGALSMTPEYLRSVNRGMVAVEQRTKYCKEVIAGDLITIHSEILEIKNKIIRFTHNMTKSYTDEMIAQTELTGVHIDTIDRKSVAFDEGIHRAAEKLMQSREAFQSV